MAIRMDRDLRRRPAISCHVFFGTYIPDPLLHVSQKTTELLQAKAVIQLQDGQVIRVPWINGLHAQPRWL